jgi:hypothetical protein
VRLRTERCSNDWQCTPFGADAIHVVWVSSDGSSQILGSVPPGDFLHYGWAIGLYAVLLFANPFAAFFLLARRFFLKHTGQKLVYVDKQLRIGEDDLSTEIRERSEE